MQLYLYVCVVYGWQGNIADAIKNWTAAHLCWHAIAKMLQITAELHLSAEAAVAPPEDLSTGGRLSVQPGVRPADIAATSSADGQQLLLQSLQRVRYPAASCPAPVLHAGGAAPQEALLLSDEVANCMLPTGNSRKAKTCRCTAGYSLHVSLCIGQLPGG